jgi:chromosome segregation ATPase
MNEADSSDNLRELDGMSIDAAVDTVVDEESTSDEVRETLAIVAQDGTVSRAAVDDVLANASMVVTTAETRVELAADKLDSVRETASPVLDLAPVSARIDTFEARLDAIEDRSIDLGDALREILAMRAAGDLYEIARRIRRVTNAATEVQRSADNFQLELDSFQEWLTDADRRAEELTDDIDALASSVNELASVVEKLDHDDSDPETEAANRWAAATVRHRLLSLMIDDLRAELSAFRTWTERERGTSLSDIESRIDDAQAGHEAIGARLAASAEPEWTSRFNDQLTAFDEALEEMDPPVAWGDIEAIVEEHRPAVEW